MLAPLLLAAAALLVASISVPNAESSLTAPLTNTVNTIATSGIFPNTCSSVVGASGAAAYLAYPFNETGGTTAADVSGNGRSGSYTSGGVTYGAAGPCPRDGGKAITLDGSSGYVSGPTTTVNPSIFSIEIWFKTTVGGGKLIGLGDQRTGLSTTHFDRQLYMSNTGTVTFGVYVLGYITITSPSAYKDGNWHDVIATLAPALDPNAGIHLYVDGAQVASNILVFGADNFNGYWRIGFDNLTGWPNAPTDFYFTGSLAFASTYTYALSPAQVLAQYNAGI